MTTSGQQRQLPQLAQDIIASIIFLVFTLTGGILLLVLLLAPLLLTAVIVGYNFASTASQLAASIVAMGCVILVYRWYSGGGDEAISAWFDRQAVSTICALGARDAIDALALSDKDAHTMTDVPLQTIPTGYIVAISALGALLFGYSEDGHHDGLGYWLSEGFLASAIWWLLAGALGGFLLARILAAMRR